MSEWPPKPPVDSQKSTETSQPTGQEWKILEKAVLSSVEEQRRARRWGIFFKLLTFIYLLVMVVLLGRGCSTTTEENSSGVTAAHIAVVDIQGTIGSDKNSVNSEDTNRALKRAFSALGSQAIVLNINSPGGSPVQSDEIWQEIRYQKQQYPDKKVYAVISDMGASGAYYIASAADQIYVNPSSIVGSIGVIMPNYGVSELAKKLGVEDRTLTSGEHKAVLSMTKPINPDEKAHVQALLDNVHQHFIDAVKAGRGSRLKTNTPDLFSGLFWTGDQAIKLGLADKTGNLTTLSRELKLNKKVDYTVQRNPLEAILGKMGTAVGQGIGQSISQQVEAQSQVTLQ
ncbi:signal peptide peptidase SppA [Acinetobacter qingfengensis]|uniref:Peptidase S49 n=1 Tax=Acinetobacter qingfengensis TaxID=1262585 RepID=A0A1E7RFJ4_9GAMM|nr:signal peptide peptidase SppA [Acinetobacter qingfengensis]KAA8731820.1 signal peptide peptidase SppA [Acinetobacter qingfengensis]OEY98056.1 peptidase S49 [Acinetobacter qingfengensis]